MTKTIYRAIEKGFFGKTIFAVFLLSAWVASSPAQTALPAATKAYVYWTNNKNGSVGRATTAGTGAKEKFIASITGGVGGGAGLTVNGNYIYWTSANGGTATTIGRADLNGTDVDQKFISTGNGVCGVAVTKSHIYWANYETEEIGRANLDGSDVNNSFISGAEAGSGIAIEGSYIYFTASSGTAIGRANLDGSDVNASFITGLNGEIAFLSADSTNIYWADWGDRGTGTTIGRAKLDGTDVDQDFVKGTKGGFGIAVTGGNP